MEDIMTEIRRAVTDEQAGEMGPRTAETRQATGGNPEAGLLSREATAAVGSGVQYADGNCEEARADTGRCSTRNAAPYAEVVAEPRILPSVGQPDGAGGNRAGRSWSLIFIATCRIEDAAFSRFGVMFSE